MFFKIAPERFGLFTFSWQNSCISPSSSNVELCTEKLAPSDIKCQKLSENNGKENERANSDAVNTIFQN
jgi:hypothetical protein